MTDAPSTLTTIGLFILMASLPISLIMGALDLALDTWPGFFFVAIVTLVIGAFVAFIGAL